MTSTAPTAAIDLGGSPSPEATADRRPEAATPAATSPANDRQVENRTLVMTTVVSMVIRNSPLEPSARCLVCGNDIPAGEGLTVRYADRILRFKCLGCLTRFEADPARYLAGHEAGCCSDERERSPASEWRCD